MFSHFSCLAIFDENDKFAGKRVEIDGIECYPVDRMLYYDKNAPIYWLVPFKEGSIRHEIEENTRSEVLDYIKSKSKELKFSLIEYTHE